MTVVDVAPGGGYWTEILAPYAKKTGGHYIAAMGKAGQMCCPANLDVDKAVYGVHLNIRRAPKQHLRPAGSGQPAAPIFVLTARNIR